MRKYTDNITDDVRVKFVTEDRPVSKTRFKNTASSEIRLNFDARKNR